MFDVTILGSNGFIGNNLSAFLLDLGLKVHCISRNTKFFQKNKFCNIPQTDFIVYLAESNFVSKADGENVLRNNISRLESAISESCGAKFIYISSALVYGDKESSPRKEIDPIISSDYYTKSKLECEEVAAAYDSLIIRLSNVYGLKMQHVNIFTDIMNQLNQKNIMVKNLMPIRDFLHLLDLCRFIYQVIENWSPGIFNVGSGRGTQIKEIVEIFIENSSSNAKVQASASCPENSCLILDIEKAKRVFKWQPKIDIYSGIEMLLEN